ncbi:DUF2244 domain-containing protein [Phaeobacter marinintestinus]|uniref:DUF2244 domain-containing protein n=1 Tax=Falsiphaeobacter marinintestinus TaxID=1492905 RepID=UPI00319EBA91
MRDMPYDWIKPDTPSDTRELHVWPHQSLPPKGLAVVVMSVYLLITIPLFGLLGSVAFWGILPFAMLAVAGIWYALNRSYHDRRIMEVLTLTHDTAHLVRRNPNGETQEWDCNRYWATPEMHKKGGPVPYYVTLRGGGREVEIGAFLSEDERIELYDDLIREIRPNEPRGPTTVPR